VRNFNVTPRLSRSRSIVKTSLETPVQSIFTRPFLFGPLSSQLVTEGRKLISFSHSRSIACCTKEGDGILAGPGNLCW
jgi:hypothetical protein